jgi:hypothetical protein
MWVMVIAKTFNIYKKDLRDILAEREGFEPLQPKGYTMSARAKKPPITALTRRIPPRFPPRSNRAHDIGARFLRRRRYVERERRLARSAQIEC